MINISKRQALLILLVCVVGLFFAFPNFLPRDTAQKSLPSWLRQFSYGLDLQGGAYLLLEADMSKVVETHKRDVIKSLRDRLTAERRTDPQLTYDAPRLSGNSIIVRVHNADKMGVVRDAMRTVARDAQTGGSSVVGRGERYRVQETEGGRITLTITEAGIAALNDKVIDQSLEIVRRRLDPEGTRELTIQRQGLQRIIVEVPGVDDTQELKRRLGETAKLTFHLPHPSILPQEGMNPPPGYLLLKGERSEGGIYLINEDVALDGAHLTDAQAQFQDGQWAISFRLDRTGAAIFCKISQENLKKPFAIVLDTLVLSAPVIQSHICGGAGVITGNFTVNRASDLALLLRAGALPAPLKVVEERTVGASLGADAIEAGTWAAFLGVTLVVVWLTAVYGLFGIFAIVALLMNLIFLAAAMSGLQATLTLPGIAGIVLSLGMSVDANVLIYERMREEMRMGRTPLSIIDQGFRQAMTAIWDSNITVIIAGALLYIFGSGPVKGFGVTLALGVTFSMFTAVMLTRLQVVYWWRWRKPKTLPI